MSTASQFAEEYALLEKRILTFMAHPTSPEDGDTGFNRLALDILGFQVRHNEPYANYCRAILAQDAPGPAAWREIPPLPTDAFRAAETPPACFPVESAERFFETSGTTAGTPGRLHLWSSALYRESILLGWRARGLPELPVAVLTPSPGAAPHSSLSFMMDTLAENFGSAIPGTPWLISPEGTIDLARFEACIEEAGRPFLLLGTALSFLHLFDTLATKRPGRTFHLPPGCVAMETGGYKGTRRELGKEELYALFESELGLPPADIINEYGMTELASQFYTSGLDAPHRGAHWTRVRVIDSESGAEAAPGEPGHLALVDLANLGSCLAISTRDLAVAAPSPHPGSAFTLIGRDPAALPRGCSRAADEILEGAWKDSRTDQG